MTMNYTKQGKRLQAERAEAWRRLGGATTVLIHHVVDGVLVEVAISPDGRRRVLGPVVPARPAVEA